MLDINKKAEVRYVIPIWLRDEQIKHAIKTVKGRIEPNHEPQTEPVAVVAYGPSLNDTWEKVKKFKWVISCSGSHRFLIDRGIIPNWHVAVDPLKNNTVQLIGQPHPDVEYLIASTCHPDVFEHLKDYNVKLWHVFDSTQDGLRTLPPGEWAITGGCDVGLRSMSMAAFFGFTELHMFGFDGSARGKVRHAADHPTSKQKFDEVNYKGKTFYTTPSMLAAAQQVIHELDQLPNIKAKFYGKGLIQAMTKDYVRTPTKVADILKNAVGFAKPALISSEYRQLNFQLHQENMAYGSGGDRHVEKITKIAETLNTKDILDYGCGKGRLGRALPWNIAEYDPAIPGKDETPKPADIVVCTDVLEHIEPDKLDYVLSDLKRCVLKVGYFVIHTGASHKTLADGRNSHLIQERKDWWDKKLKQHFTVGMFWEKRELLFVVVGPKIKEIKKEPKPVMESMQDVTIMEEVCV